MQTCDNTRLTLVVLKNKQKKKLIKKTYRFKRCETWLICYQLSITAPKSVSLPVSWSAIGQVPFVFLLATVIGGFCLSRPTCS